MILVGLLWYLKDAFAESLSWSHRHRVIRAVRCIIQLDDKRTIPILMDMQILVDNLRAGDETRHACAAPG